MTRFRRSWPAAARSRRSGAVAIGAALSLSLAPGGLAAAEVAVLTHHYDVSRSGWNQHETVLTPATVGTPGAQGAFGLLATVPLDSTAEGQPLVVPGVKIEGDPNAGNHDVVYVGTDANTIYAIDPTAGTVLLSRNLGTPGYRGNGCSSGGVGIGSTPAIDRSHNAIYLISYTDDTATGGAAQYVLHELNLATLKDLVRPVIVAGSQTLTTGASLAFNPLLQRQRPALLEYDDTIYAAFGSVCDNNPARGWVFAWNAVRLEPVHADAAGAVIPALTNSDATAPGGKFLSSIWMSGAGPAADATGIYYVTGNSDKSGATYNPVTNTEQSVVRLSRDTTTVLDLFTPFRQPNWDKRDLDFGAGGVILVPSTTPGGPLLAAAAGKAGYLYLMNRTDLGGYTPGGPDKVLATVKIGSCWCAASYFDDGTPTLVSSGGSALNLWKVQPQSKPALVSRAPATTIASGPSAGFFTSVSSNGADDTIVWAVTRPVSTADTRVWLYGFAVGLPGTALKQIYSAPAGNWTIPQHNSNLVPVVANGRVYVASSGMLAIFGLAPPAAAPNAN